MVIINSAYSKVECVSLKQNIDSYVHKDNSSLLQSDIYFYGENFTLAIKKYSHSLVMYLSCMCEQNYKEFPVTHS